MTDTTRSIANLVSWGIVLTVLGFALGIAAAHQSLFFSTLSAMGQTPFEFDEFGNGTPVDNWAPWVAWLAALIVVAGAWCLVAAVWRVADRTDGGSGGHRPGAPLPAATLALAAPAEEVEASRSAEQRPGAD